QLVPLRRAADTFAEVGGRQVAQDCAGGVPVELEILDEEIEPAAVERRLDPQWRQHLLHDGGGDLKGPERYAQAGWFGADDATDGVDHVLRRQWTRTGENERCSGGLGMNRRALKRRDEIVDVDRVVDVSFA